LIEQLGADGRRNLYPWTQPTMRIDHIEVLNLRFEYPSERQFRYAGGICTARLTTLVRVHTDTGHVGTGAVYTHPGLATLVIKGQFEPMLRGRDPRDVESLWREMYLLTRWYGRKGAAHSALGALDIAFWDLRGQALGKPVRELLGGGKSSVPAYASSLLWKDSVKELAQEAEGHLARGFRRMKMRLGRGEDYDVPAIQAVRRAIGPDNDFMADGSMRYTVAQARKVAAVLRENRAFWFEEPFEPEDIDSYAAMRGTVGVLLAAGENEFGLPGFRELIHRKTVDIVQADASRCGGITEAWLSARAAADAGLLFAPHTWSDAVAVVANAHVVAAVPNGLTVEVDQTGNPFIEELLTEPLSIRNGMLQLSDRPGLGITLNEKTVERYRLADPLAIPAGNYSDMVFVDRTV